MKYKFYGLIKKEELTHSTKLLLELGEWFTSYEHKLKSLQNKLDNFDKNSIIKRSKVIDNAYLFEKDTEFQLKIGDSVLYKNKACEIISQNYDKDNDQMICTINYLYKLIEATQEEKDECSNDALEHLNKSIEETKMKIEMRNNKNKRKSWKFW